jgi:short-subunit dehydrogenase involved in D-alanine esterification of teichoic acids
MSPVYIQFKPMSSHAFSLVNPLLFLNPAFYANVSFIHRARLLTAMSFSPKKVMIIGATSGIGLALAERYVTSGSNVIVTGRRTDRLKALQSKHGESKINPYTFDISSVSEIPKFADQILSEHPDLSIVVLNAGIQRSFDFSDPGTVDLDTLDNEWRTNYVAYVHLTHAFLPHLLQHQGSSLVYVSSGLALVHSARQINYSASKAALHAFVLGIRRQLRDKGIKVIEVVPPAVKTELHDAQKSLKFPSGVLMPLETFTDEAWKGLESGDEQIFVGELCKRCKDGWEGDRQGMVEMINKAWVGGYGKDTE